MISKSIYYFNKIDFKIEIKISMLDNRVTLVQTMGPIWSGYKYCVRCEVSTTISTLRFLGFLGYSCWG